MSLRGKVAIVGIGESDISIEHNKSPIGLTAEAVTRALDDAGLDKSDVDGLFSASAYYYMPTMTLGEYLGIRPRYTDSTAIGGCSFIAHLQHAAAAIDAGLCRVALIAYGSTQRSDRGKLVSGSEPFPYEAPFGPLFPISAYAMMAQRHMYEFGTTSEQLAEVAVATRKWAMLNPKALMRTPITIDDVLASPMISSPFHRLDCCLVTDGAGAVIVTSADVAKSLRKPPVYVLGTGEAHWHRNVVAAQSFTTTAGAESGPRAMEMAGVTHADIDVVQIYDAFTYNVIVSLEDLGFCKKGEGGHFVSGQRTAPDGDFPLNTSGGGLSYCHPGMLGMFLLIEAVRQLRHEAGERQVRDAEVALVHGIGGLMAACATAVLSNTV